MNKTSKDMFKKQNKIGAEELRIEKFSESHNEIINEFCSYEQELVDFLKEDALNQQQRKISVTYLWFLRKTNELVGYLTVSPDCVKLKSINSELSAKFQDKRINYKSLPALKIGRLCVDNKFLKKGIGSLMIQFSIKLAIGMSKNVGCRFIYLDAKRNEDTSKDAIHFYKKIGFEIYKDKNKKETPMYRDIIQEIKELSDN